MQTLWNKGVEAAQVVEDFTVGNDRELDMRLAKYDVLGSKAHIAMLTKVGLLPADEERLLQKELDNILGQIERGEFVLEDCAEDIHSQVEICLTRALGDLGKKIHSGRSRNDQVLVDLKLYMRAELVAIRELVLQLFEQFQKLSEQHKNVILPGYTHGQIAMPSSFGMWFGAYAETLCDDMLMLGAAFKIVNQNPLGSAAGYGSSFPLDRQQTTEALGFEDLNYNSVAAQMSRGKSEKAVAAALASLAATLNKFAADCCLYMGSNFKFISFPDALTTGSSIMPHKKNPDVWEIMRGKANRIQAAETTIAQLTANLPHGYHRDFQLLKDILFPTIDATKECLSMCLYMLQNIGVREDIVSGSDMYNDMFTVEEVNNMVVSGVPFRDAYRQIGIAVKEGNFCYTGAKTVTGLGHTHMGSIGNLCTEQISQKMTRAARW
ncbi:MAG: argininosuccinate lyase [Bacteroidales bacterium]|nr:argininosuccinate lyase [Bacteroidales bacterium]